MARQHQLKFRVWDGIGMTYFKTFPNSPSPKSIVMQCTGLKDAEGLWIYEKDVLKDKDGNVFRVKWQNGGFRCSTSLSKMSRIRSYLCAQKIFQGRMVVIGNDIENGL